MLLMLGVRFSGGINALMNSIGPPHHSSDAADDYLRFIRHMTQELRVPPRLQTTSALKHLPRLERRKLLSRNLRFVERRIQCVERRIDGFVGQLKRAVMMR